MTDDDAVSLNAASSAFCVKTAELHALTVIAARAPDEVVGPTDNPLWNRWYLSRAGVGEGNLYLHQFLRGDLREAPHDHPWSSLTVVLHGSYTEHSWADSVACLHDKPLVRILERGQTLMRSAGLVHRIYSAVPGTLTLFRTGVKTRDWGFVTKDGWMPWQEFDGR